MVIVLIAFFPFCLFSHLSISPVYPFAWLNQLIRLQDPGHKRQTQPGNMAGTPTCSSLVVYLYLAMPIAIPTYLAKHVKMRLGSRFNPH